MVKTKFTPVSRGLSFQLQMWRAIQEENRKISSIGACRHISKVIHMDEETIYEVEPTCPFVKFMQRLKALHENKISEVS